MGVGSSIAANITGNVEHAIIEILDERGGEVIVTPKESPKKSNMAGVSIKNLGELATAQLKQASVTASGVLDASLAKTTNTVKSIKQFKVQFNPTTLQISAQGGGTAQITSVDKGAEEDAIAQAAMDTRIQLSVQLIFDKVYSKDAFMNEKFVLDPKSMITGAAVGIANAVKKKEYTVQPIVEGFIAALRSEHTRKVTFAWGDMNYGGILNSVNSQYTMFSVTGKPVRATVTLGILCTDAKVTKGYMGQWEQHYKNAFESASKSYENGAQKVSNLLNLPF